MTPLIAVLCSYPLGLFMAKLLPRGILNPGPFGYKEHACIYVFTFIMGSVPYGVLNVICQRYLLYQQVDMPMWVCYAFVITTQLLGLGISGLYRRILCRPASMIWPEITGPLSMLNAFHKADETSVGGRDSISRFKFFWVVAGIMALYQFLPGFVAPMLGAVSVLCWFVKNRTVGDPTYKTLMMLGSSQSLGGVGFLAFTFDWSVISCYNPITTPLWATLNMFCGLYLSLWVVVPVLWSVNAFGSDQLLGTVPVDGPNGTGIYPLGFALNAAVPFDNVGNRVRPRLYLQRDPADNFSIILNQTMYDQTKPMNLTTYSVVGYFCSFLVISSSIVHVLLWYGKDLYRRFCSPKPDAFDIHAKLMEAYAFVPVWWYAAVFGSSVIGCVGIGCTASAFKLDCCLGIIQAISGHNVGLNIVSECFMGYLRPGRISSIMAFKTISYQAQNNAIALSSILKFGTYTKIPPRVMFTIQLVATLCGSLISTTTACVAYEIFGTHIYPSISNGLLRPGTSDPFRWNLEGPNFAVQGWSYYQYSRVLSEGVIMGAIGPKAFFTDSPQYFVMVYGFFAGLILPIIPWFLNRMYPYGYWHLINIPIIAAFPAKPNAMRSDLITPLLVAILVNYFIKKYRPFWWRKYAYVMSAGFDTGASFTLLVLFLILAIFQARNMNTAVRMPFWALHAVDTDGCAPWIYLQCEPYVKWDSGFKWNKTQVRQPPPDPACINFQANRPNWTDLTP
ncbi:UNVERIFIED_CONTAM: hypothetical protein HDU68_007922 [Siphonaria sp. JEL0065]|nr:hypothetical protein HDU68_007922 [Siphonaria sp. JEL0065]